MIRTDPLWFITGCSTGLGRALAEQVLDRGHRAVVTARDPGTLDDLVTAHGDRALAVALDVTEPTSIAAAVDRAESLGGVDVLVNNAGYGYLGAIEEGDEAGIRALFDTNVFGLLAVTRAVLPGLRGRRSGHVVMLSSIGGLTTFPGVGFYHGTKFAVEGLSETLATEVAPLGIGVTIVEPGAFRTDFRGRSMVQAPNRIADYAETAGAAQDAVLAGDGSQENDPVRGAAAIVAAVTSADPPLRLLLGEDALRQARTKLAGMGEEFDAWEQLTTSTRFDDRQS